MKLKKKTSLYKQNAAKNAFFEVFALEGVKMIFFKNRFRFLKKIVFLVQKSNCYVLYQLFAPKNGF